MTKSSLRDGVRRLIVAHPDVHPSVAGHATYIERYRTGKGANIGLEKRGERHQNLFVELHRVDLRHLEDIPSDVYPAIDFPKRRPNHNLFHIDSFREVDIVRFKLAELSQAVRVLDEVMR